MTIFSPAQGGGGGGGTFHTYLIDNELNEINVWNHPRGAASMPYLLEDSTLIYPYRVQNVTMNSGGVGGGIAKYSWEGELFGAMKLPMIYINITMMLSHFQMVISL